MTACKIHILAGMNVKGAQEFRAEVHCGKDSNGKPRIRKQAIEGENSIGLRMRACNG